jgi:N-acetylmuramoyl-L-alanine amidase
MKVVITVLLAILLITFAIRSNHAKLPDEIFPVDTSKSPAVALEPLKLSFEHLTEEQQQEVRCLAHNIYFEARSEPIDGQLAVAYVTLNRVESTLFPDSICGVVQQRRRNVCQFSWWCDSRLQQRFINNQIANKEIYKDIKRMAVDIVTGQQDIMDITEGALFYHAQYVEKRKLGSMQLVHTATIGQHVFYRIPR